MGIKPNKIVDHLAKSASLIGDPLDSNITYKKILFSLRHEYSCIDAHFIGQVSKGTDSYYILFKFRDTKMR